MVEHTAVVKSKSGLHARPAALLMKEAKKYVSDITVAKTGKSCSAKSIVSILSLGITCGETITITCSGPDEEDALSAILGVLEHAE